jgi:hypothetical protein
MSFKFNDKRKSPKKRFLLILGAVVFVCFLGLGFMVIFSDKILPGAGYQKPLFGGLIIIYSILRFSRLLKKEENEEE